MPLSFHLFGPFSVHLYGFFIFLGVVALLYALRKDAIIRTSMRPDQLYNLTTYGIIGGVVGGKLLYLFEYATGFSTFFEELPFWQGGFSVLGTILGVACVVIGYLYQQKLPFFTIGDRIALYTPLAQALGRIGCFYAGCCHGLPTNHLLSVIYTDPESLAPLYRPLIPTQVISSLCLCVIFLFLRWQQKKFKNPGQLLAFFMMWIALERFAIDFLRADRTLVFGPLSLIQMVAIGIFVIGQILFYISKKHSFSFFAPKNNERF